MSAKAATDTVVFPPPLAVEHGFVPSVSLSLLAFKVFQMKVAPGRVLVTGWWRLEGEGGGLEKKPLGLGFVE